MAGESEYQAFLRAKHERRFNTPLELRERWLGEVAGRRIVTWEQITKGEANEVWAADTTCDRFILRISGDPEGCGFTEEQWALDQVRPAGVPVPEILLLTDASIGDFVCPVCIERRLPGEALADLSLADEQRSSVLRSAGAHLARIHSIRPFRCGRLDAGGRGEFPSAREYILSQVPSRPTCADLEERAGLPSGLVTLAATRLRSAAETFPETEPRLVHNDFGPKHILVSGGEITGILDFENVRSGDPASDLARWRFFYPEGGDFKALLEGYRSVEALPTELERRMAVWTLALALASIHYYVDENNPYGLALATERLGPAIGALA